MITQEAIRTRRAVKQYDPQVKLSAEEVKELLELTILSPTSFNIQNWRIVHIQDPALRKEVRAAAWDQAQVEEASELFLICGDVKSWSKNPERYWKNVPEPTRGIMVSMIGPFYEGKEQLQRDEVLRSGGIAAQTLMLAARSLGYDSCPMIGFDQGAVGQLVKLPEDHEIVMMVAVGKAKAPAFPRGGQVDLKDVVIQNTF